MSAVATPSKSVLVAEDNELHLRLIGSILKRAGWTVWPTGDGKVALQNAVNTNYDLLILDENMPHVRGLEITRRLRDLGKTTPVIIVTSVPIEEFKRLAKEAGVFKVLGSPVDRTWLLRTVDDALMAQQFSTPHDG